jgi:hypothetical protein
MELKFLSKDVAVMGCDELELFSAASGGCPLVSFQSFETTRTGSQRLYSPVRTIILHSMTSYVTSMIVLSTHCT